MVSKVLVISKRSALERVRGKKKKLVGDTAESLRAEAGEHKQTARLVRSALNKRGISVEYARRRIPQNRTTPYTGYDLVITVGGDGTLLYASHRILDIPVLGVLSSRKGSIGVLCGADEDSFEGMLDKILEGGLKATELQRLKAQINGYPVPTPVLNEVLFANEFPAATARYELKRGKRSEFQKSSGVWVSTAAGSTAAILAAGGKTLPIGSRKFAFKVREPFFSEGGRHITGGVLGPEETLVINSTTIRGAVYVDGQPPAYRVGYNGEVSIGLSGHPLKIYGYNEKRRREIIEANS